MKSFPIIQAIFFCLTLFYSTDTTAQSQREIKLTIGVGNFPPFFVKKTESGIFWDLIGKVFEKLPQYQVSYIEMSQKRMVEELNRGRLSGAANINSRTKIRGFRSKPIFRYGSKVAALKRLDLKSISDLKNFSVVTWQGARNAYGAEFKNMTLANKNYIELPDPKGCVRMVASARADVCILDQFLFLYYLKSGAAQASPSVFTFHGLLDNIVNTASMVFLSEAVRDDFDRIVGELTARGELDAIYRSYLKNMSAN